VICFLEQDPALKSKFVIASRMIYPTLTHMEQRHRHCVLYCHCSIATLPQIRHSKPQSTGPLPFTDHSVNDRLHDWSDRIRTPRA